MQEKRGVYLASRGWDCIIWVRKWKNQQEFGGACRGEKNIRERKEKREWGGSGNTTP